METAFTGEREGFACNKKRGREGLPASLFTKCLLLHRQPDRQGITITPLLATVPVLAPPGSSAWVSEIVPPVGVKVPEPKFTFGDF